MWLIRFSYKFEVFPGIVFYEGLPTKARLIKGYQSNGIFPSCLRVENNETPIPGMLFFQASLEVYLI